VTENRFEVVFRDEQGLHVRACTHFLRRAHGDPHLARANVFEERGLRGVAVVILNEGDFIAGNAKSFQLLGHVVIDREALIFRRGEVTEHKLGRTLRPGFLPDVEDLFDRQIHLALRFVRRGRFHQPEIQGRLPPLGCDFEHVVHARINAAGFQLLGAGGQ